MTPVSPVPTTMVTYKASLKWFEILRQKTGVSDNKTLSLGLCINFRLFNFADPVKIKQDTNFRSSRFRESRNERLLDSLTLRRNEILPNKAE